MFNNWISCVTVFLIRNGKELESLSLFKILRINRQDKIYGISSEPLKHNGQNFMQEDVNLIQAEL